MSTKVAITVSGTIVFIALILLLTIDCFLTIQSYESTSFKDNRHVNEPR